MTRFLSTLFLLLASYTGGPDIGMVQTGQALAASDFFGGTQRLSYTPRVIAAAPSTAAGRMIVVASVRLSALKSKIDPTVLEVK